MGPDMNLLQPGRGPVSASGARTGSFAAGSHVLPMQISTGEPGCSRFSCTTGSMGGQGSARSMRKMIVEVCPTDPLMGMHTDAPGLNRVLLLISTYGEVRNVIFEEASFSGNGLFSRRDRRDLLVAAKQYGYYEYPRKINSRRRRRRSAKPPRSSTCEREKHGPLPRSLQDTDGRCRLSGHTVE